MASSRLRREKLRARTARGFSVANAELVSDFSGPASVGAGLALFEAAIEDARSCLTRLFRTGAEAVSIAPRFIAASALSTRSAFGCAFGRSASVFRVRF
ncbi:hypothetical protein MPC4_240033 [Methylocella tundrae]|uniref:Uncharacterized protein n=1 Tax=Methylocella tundrae TaxID=227605 RepID=A0A8B6M8T7_METTU|nr:hypothetical protein MPC4_240033 [Methylocella tundrae]